MSAEIINLEEYRKKREADELESLRKQVLEATQSISIYPAESEYLGSMGPIPTEFYSSQPTFQYDGNVWEYEYSTTSKLDDDYYYSPWDQEE